MSQFTHTDTGVFRQCLLDAKVSNGDNTIYNDMNGGLKRRLKAEGYYWGGGRSDTSPAAMARLTPLLKKAYGKRFIRVAINQDGAICLYLTDDFGGPFQRVAQDKPAKPRYPSYRRPKRLECQEIEAFWSEAIGRPINKFWHVYTTKHDVPVYKKACIDQNGRRLNVIVNLVIPAGSKVHVTYGKCRANQALVASIHEMRGERVAVKEAHSMHDPNFKYVPGQLVKPKNGFGGAGMGDCAGGIHFFIDVNRALDY
jgi:hypothetical protein